jgi:hypothetical protein
MSLAGFSSDWGDYDDDPWAGGIGPFAKDWDDPSYSPRHITEEEWAETHAMALALGRAAAQMQQEAALEAFGVSDP